MTKSMKKMISLILVLCLCFSLAAPAMAASPWSSRSSSSLLGGCFGQTSEPEEEEEETVTEPEPEETVTEEVTEDAELVLIEDESTVENGEMLRASTYALRTADAGTDADYGIMTTADTSGVKYFPVTMFNYDRDTINELTHQLEVEENPDLTYWNGIYFGYGEPETDNYTYTSGEATYSVASVTYANLASSDVTQQKTNYYYYVNGTYEPVYVTRTSSGWLSTTYSYTLFYGDNLTRINTNEYTITNTSNSFSRVTLYVSGNTISTGSIPYAPHNVWTNKIFDADSSNVNYTFGELGLRTSNPNNQYGSDTGTRAGHIYEGLVEDTLDANNNIQFTVPDVGIFDVNSEANESYLSVQMPFQFDGTTYTFDSATRSAMFDDYEAADGAYLVDDVNTRNARFMPFGTGDYHFGMSANIKFSMTKDGTLTGADGEDIIFNFNGDDDVWVFIDGKLVLDMGGIHDTIDGTINFAENTTLIQPNVTDQPSGYINTTEGAVAATLSDYVFNEYDEEGNLVTQGILNQTIETFSAKEDHYLTVFYLERGANNSNCMITFNLPMKDSVTVQKVIDGQATVNDNGSVTYTDLSDLSAEQLRVLNNLDFGFTLYKNGTPVANETYYLIDQNGQVIATPSTDATGHFTLKNYQTARFVGSFTEDASGESYYVVEDIKDGFIATQYTASVATAANAAVTNQAAGSHTYYAGVEGNESSVEDDALYYVTNKTYSDGTLESNTYTVSGSDEAEDSLAFICKNYMNASLPRPSAIPADDTIVIDYGLPVVVDLFSNDLYLADSTAITFPSYETNAAGAYVADYGTFTYDSATRSITYTLDKQLTGVEVINYTLTGYATGAAEVVTATGTADVTIIPATSMYYEEDFGFVTFSDAWTGIGSAQTDNQEPGVVGTANDSPYGSDAAYLNDIHDSNGTSMYVNTNDASASFNYSFTGTGTTIFARTTNNSGYIIVSITDEEGNGVAYHMRDTSYKIQEDDDPNLTMYNIPVYTWEGDYGTYNVSVTVSKYFAFNGTTLYGGEFWLDGIRVIDPLGTTDENTPDSTDITAARRAYNADGEANMSTITLRNKLINDYTDIDEETGDIFWTDEASGFVVFTDSNGEIQDASEYKTNGPKEEVYLNDGQSITFSLYDWDANTNKLYLGIKAPSGAGTVVINNNTVNINNAADCYYEIGRYASITEDTDGVKIATFTITAGADSLISVTNIKVTGNFEFVIVKQEDVEVDAPDYEE